nr:SKP1-like protein 1A [Tanacetum cinerariifolium]
PTFSQGIVAGEGILYERSPATFPRRKVAGERNPRRQVAGESPELSLGKVVNVVVLEGDLRDQSWRYRGAACGLQIRSLLDVTSEAVVDMIIGKTPEEIHKMFNMNQDLTFEEIVEVFEMEDWCFE